MHSACRASTPFRWEWAPLSTGSTNASNPRRAPRCLPSEDPFPHLARGQDRRRRGDGRDFGRRCDRTRGGGRSEEHTSELQSLMRISYAVFCLKKKKKYKTK